MIISRRAFLKGTAGVLAASVIPSAAASYCPIDPVASSSPIERKPSVFEIPPRARFLLEYDSRSFNKAISRAKHFGLRCSKESGWWLESEDGSIWAVCQEGYRGAALAATQRPVLPMLPAAFLFGASCILDLDTKTVVKSRNDDTFWQIAERAPGAIAHLKPV